MRVKQAAVWKDLLAVTMIFLVATLVSVLCGVAVKKIVPEIDFTVLTVILYTVQFLLAIGGAWVFYRRRGEGMLRFSFNWYNAPLALGGIVLAAAEGIVLEPVLNLFPEHYFEQMADMLDSGGWTIVLTVVLAPIFEEVFFRGIVLEQTLRRSSAGRAVAVSALLFGLVHLPNLPQAVNALVMGIVIGYIYTLTRSLIPVTIVHAINNGIAYLLLETTGTQSTDTRAMIGNDTLYWIIFGASAAVLAVSLLLMWLFARRRDTKSYKTPLHEEITHDEQ